MADPALQAQINAAIAYQDLFVPALFQQWAPRVVAAAQIEPSHRVLDVACGTGVLAREAARPGAAGLVAGLDPDAGMLVVARGRAPEVGWCQGTAESLPYSDRSFNAIISQFGLMFFTDQRQALREMLRVLVPGGQLCIAVWDCLDNTPAYAAAVALLERIAGQRAADALRAPFVLGDPKELATLFASTGVASIGITTHRGTARFPSIRSMVEADLRGWLPVMGVVLSEDEIGRILEAAEDALGSYVVAEGAVRFDVLAHIIRGRGVSKSRGW